MREPMWDGAGEGNSFIAEGSEQVKVVINATSFVLTVESRKSNYVG